jgi:5-methylcytosine-specific restriction endonuclease McrA
MPTTTLDATPLGVASTCLSKTRTVQVLNASFEPLRAVPIRRAVQLLARDRAVVHADDGSGRYIIWARESRMWAWPAVIRLREYVHVAFEHLAGVPRWSKAGVIKRDHHICAYCSSARGYTVDHIVPKAQGGRDTWLNTVACCEPCNSRKADRTPEQAGMKLRRTPFRPRGRT